MQTAEKATPTKELIKIDEANILRDSATDISASKAAEQIPVRVAGRYLVGWFVPFSTVLHLDICFYPVVIC